MKSKRGNIVLAGLLITAAVALILIILRFASPGRFSTKLPPSRNLTWEECLKTPESSVEYSDNLPTCKMPDGRLVTKPVIDSLTKNWFVYENKTLGFSVKYPPDKELAVKLGDADTVYFMKPNTDYGFIVKAYDNPNFSAPSKWIKDNFNNLYKGVLIDGKPVNLSDLSISNSGNSISEIKVGTLPSFFLIGHPYKDKIYKVDGSMLDKTDFDLILNSFIILGP